MTARIAPDLVSDELLGLTTRLGLPERDLVILAEGNTSELIADGTIIVKTSGSSMQTATAENFVSVEIEPLLAVLRDPHADQDQLTAELDAGEVEGKRVRASIETLIHVAVRAYAPARYVAHTHPTAVVSLLASIHAETSFADAVYSDELMVLGRSLYIPYAQPGIELGQLFLEKLGAHVDEFGEVPSLILLGNHGIVAIADTAEGAEAISLMAVKSARVRLGALQAGGIASLSAEVTAHYFDRPDFRERRAALTGTVK
ncbi:class II aldolase/adducin family protein [Salinibacterium amurskyense]|uniref:class II aldolase/adducin family protein n=1 Tax=Salinibacterium amurskyense TaxID=205941 RepID=UPI00311FA5E7